MEVILTSSLSKAGAQHSSSLLIWMKRKIWEAGTIRRNNRNSCSKGLYLRVLMRCRIHLILLNITKKAQGLVCRTRYPYLLQWRILKAQWISSGLKDFLLQLLRNKLTRRVASKSPLRLVRRIVTLFRTHRIPYRWQIYWKSLYIIMNRMKLASQ